MSAILSPDSTGPDVAPAAGPDPERSVGASGQAVRARVCRFMLIALARSTRPLAGSPVVYSDRRTNNNKTPPPCAINRLSSQIVALPFTHTHFS